MSSSSPSSPQSLYGFGSNYFYQLGGTTPVNLPHQNEDESDEPDVPGFYMMVPPWNHNAPAAAAAAASAAASNTNSDDDIIQDIQCTWTASIFLTKKGKVYQTGTVHGKLASMPRPVMIRLPLKVAQIAAGRHFCLAKMDGGLAVCSWGAGHFGQLGQGGKIALLQEPMVMERLLPHIIGAPIRQVAAGGWHGLAVTTTGQIWAWGSNRRHQCGILPGSTIVNSSSCDTSSEASLSSTVAYPQPIHCEGANFSKVACGRAHSVALDEESGNVYCWGSSLYGQCGQSSRKTSVPAPRKVDTLSQVHLVDVAAGEFHTLALTGGGRVFSWGAGSEGQLGHGVSVTFGKPKLVGDLDFRAIMAGQDWKYHNMHSSSNNNNHNNNNNSLSGLHSSGGTELSASRGTTTTTTTNTIISTFDNAPFDERGGDAVLASNSESSSKIHSSRRGSNNAFAASPIPPLKGKVGFTTSSELGDGSETSYTIDTLTGPPLSIDGTTAKSIDSSSGLVPRITSIHASGSYSAAISSSGHLYTWGYNDVGMLGLPKPKNHLVNIENMTPKTSSLRQLQGCSFDSRHLVLLPRRVDALADIHVTGVSTGPCHLWCWGTPRLETDDNHNTSYPHTTTTLVGRTLYEVQELRRKRSLHRMRRTHSNRGNIAQIKEDIYFDGGVDDHHHHPYGVGGGGGGGGIDDPANPSSSSSGGGGAAAAAATAPHHNNNHNTISVANRKESSHSSSKAKQKTVTISETYVGSPTAAPDVGVGASNHQASSSHTTESRATAATATGGGAASESDNISLPEKESWRFSIGMGKVLRRFSNPRGVIVGSGGGGGGDNNNMKEKRPPSRLRSQVRTKEDNIGIPPPSPSTTAVAAAADTTTDTLSAAAADTATAPPPSAATAAVSRFSSKRQSRSRSTPPAQSRSLSQTRTTVSLGGRYRKNRKPPAAANNAVVITDDGKPAVTDGRGSILEESNNNNNNKNDDNKTSNDESRGRPSRVHV